ncbi:MAG: phosphoglucosamine mutase [Acidobacteria bacterium]|nr:MAG: phosphoglucosamine mutase [Acidobacteriota bacterium]
MKRLFGTDGMRGAAGSFPLDADTIWTTGHSLARHLTAQTGPAPRIVTGRDTRESGAWLEAALIAGARAAGALCESAGVITTPGVAFLTRTLPADAGVVISASHNPFQDNGIKIFAPTGRKLDDTTERLIEADIYAARERTDTHEVAQRHNAPFQSDEIEADAHAVALRARYLDYLVNEIGAGLRLDDLILVMDCAHGAAFELAPALCARLGAQVVAVGITPDGRNINRECGSLYVERLRERVVAAGAHLGVAFDGDADRALFVDARGTVVDGDATLWVMAQQMSARGELKNNLVVATVMSNIGLESALKSRGIELRRTDVGDKYVLEELLRTGASLGGEQSGHIIFPRLSLAGDGLVTTLCLLRAMRESSRHLHELTAGFTRYPQVLVNVRVGEKRPFADVPEIARAVRATEKELGDRGRLLLRYSGTEPLARVMIEGQRQDEIERLAQALARIIQTALGAK